MNFITGERVAEAADSLFGISIPFNTELSMSPCPCPEPEAEEDGRGEGKEDDAETASEGEAGSVGTSIEERRPANCPAASLDAGWTGLRSTCGEMERRLKSFPLFDKEKTCREKENK